MSRVISLLLISCFSLTTGSVYALDTAAYKTVSSHSPSLEVVLPGKGGKSGYPHMQPVNVLLQARDKTDGLLALSIEVISNPDGYRQALTARFPGEGNVKGVRTRIRLSGKRKAVIKVTGKTRSGKQIVTEKSIKHRNKVDFADATTLTLRLPANVKLLPEPVGNAMARIVEGANLSRRFQAIIYHPMLPAIDDQPENRLDSLVVDYRGSILAEFEYGYASSNDPYLDLLFVDQQPGIGEVKARWQDNRGAQYNPPEVKVKKLGQ